MLTFSYFHQLNVRFLWNNLYIIYLPWEERLISNQLIDNSQVTVFVQLKISHLSNGKINTRGAWAPVSLHRPDISTMAKGSF